MAHHTDRLAFTQQLRNALSGAGEEASRYGHQWVGTEHLLLAVIQHDDTTAAQVLTMFGIDLPTIRRRIDFLLRRGEGPGICPPGLTPRAWRVVELGLLESQQLDHRLVTTGHFLVGMLVEPEGMAGRVLEEQGLEIDDVRSEVESFLRSEDTEG